MKNQTIAAIVVGVLLAGSACLFTAHAENSPTPIQKKFAWSDVKEGPSRLSLLIEETGKWYSGDARTGGAIIYKSILVRLASSPAPSTQTRVF
jgi:hypothetical protein